MAVTNRRGFLKQIALSSESSQGSSIGLAGQQTLVCVFLRGGADTLNFVIPYGDDQYYRLRPTISIAPPGNDRSSIKIDDFYAFHPKLSPLYPVFKEGRLGIVQAVGSDNVSGSHFEAQDQMEHGEGASHSLGGGWIGRFMRTRNGSAMTPLSAVAIGATIPESMRGAPTATAMQSIEELRIKTQSEDPRAVVQALAAMYSAEVGLLSGPGKTTLDLLRRVESLRESDYKPQNGALYPEDDFGDGLREIARLVKARVGLDVACVDLSGWDTHFFQGTSDGLQAEQIDLLARGLAAFDADLGSERSRVTVIVMTEFGRRVYENSSLGTDHGRGFAMMAIGDRIDGGKIHGDWPGLEEESSGLLGPEGLKVSYDYRSALGEILSRVMGVKNLSRVFPGFHPQPVGLLKA